MSRKLFYYKGIDLVFGAKSFLLSKYLNNYKQPVLLYDAELIKERINWVQSWSGLGRLHYAMKANFNIEILKIFKDMNCGLDVVSLGEIRQALKVGFTPKDIIFSGVAKSQSELAWSIENEIYQINIESLSELQKIINISKKLNKTVSVGLRVNPEIDAETHPSISTALKDSKFGLDMEIAKEAIQLISTEPLVQLKAISFHLGSQILNIKVYEKALKILKPFFKLAQKSCPELERFDLGGGLGIDYKNSDLDLDQQRWAGFQELLSKELKDFNAFVLLELGRFLVARSGVLLSKIEVIKKNSYNKKFLILDVGMSHLIRPALYQAYHEIVPIKLKSGSQAVYEIVGPICESTDVLSTQKKMTYVEENDFVAICDVGAYGSSMASSYNLREPMLEVVVY